MLRSLLLGLSPAECALRQAFTGASRLPSLLSSAQGSHQQQQSYASEAKPDSAAQSITPTDLETSEQEGDTDLQVLNEREVEQLQPQEKQQKKQQQLPEVQQRLPGPIQPTHIVLKALQDWEGDLPTKADLWLKISQDYPDLFRSRTQVCPTPQLHQSMCCEPSRSHGSCCSEDFVQYKVRMDNINRQGVGAMQATRLAHRTTCTLARAWVS
jgi:DNA segregation ATPase FtsK/SpoIIIE-like protein